MSDSIVVMDRDSANALVTKGLYWQATAKKAEADLDKLLMETQQLLILLDSYRHTLLPGVVITAADRVNDTINRIMEGGPAWPLC